MAPTTRSSAHPCESCSTSTSGSGTGKPDPNHSCSNIEQEPSERALEEDQTVPIILLPSNEPREEEESIVVSTRSRTCPLGREMNVLDRLMLGSASTSTTGAACPASSKMKGKSSAPIRLGGPGKENVPPLEIEGVVLVGLDGSDEDEDEDDEMNLRPRERSSRRSRNTGPSFSITEGVAQREDGPLDNVGGVRKTRATRRSVAADVPDEGMNIDDLEGTDREDEGIVLIEEDEDLKRRKRRRTEAGSQSSSTSSSTCTPLSAHSLSTITGGSLSLPGPTGAPNPGRSRFSSAAAGGMKTRSGTTITPRTIPRTRGTDASSTSTSSSLAPPPGRFSRPRTLSQSSSHSSLNGVMITPSGNSSHSGTTGAVAGRLARSVSYAYGFSTSGSVEDQNAGRAGQSEERRSLRRSDSSRSSMSMKRKDREMSVSSVMSVRSENMSAPPMSSSSMSSAFSFYVPAQGPSTMPNPDPFSFAFGSVARTSPELDPEMDQGEASISGTRTTNRRLFPSSSSTTARRSAASPRRSTRKPRSTTVEDAHQPTSSPGAARLFSPARSRTPPATSEPVTDINTTPRRARRLQARDERDGSCTPTKLPSLMTGDEISPSASQESEQIVTPKISRYVSRLTLEQQLQNAADRTSIEEPFEDEGIVFEEKQLNAYKVLKTALRCSSAGSGSGGLIVGREQEKLTIKAYLENGRIEGTGSPRALYVSGPPGTGKTATVGSIADELKVEGWQTVSVNCMGMASGRRDDVWNRIALGWGLDGKGERAVDSGLSSASPDDKRLLILDEVDALLSAGSCVNANNTLRALFTLPSSYVSTTVRVIAISNSLDLTARRSISSALSDLAPDNLTFTAYGSKEMVNIVKARVQSVKEAAELGGKERVEMDEKAIELVGRKVEASNGDLRMCLNVMVEAVGTTEMEWKKKSLNGPVPLVKVTLTQVLKALTSSIAKLKANAASNTSSGGAGSAIENKIRSLNVQVRMILLSLLVSRQRIALGLRPAHLPAQSASHAPATASKELEVTLESLLPTYAHILSHPSSPFAPAGQTDFMDLIMQAEVIGIISLHSSTSGPMTPTKTPSRRKNGKNGGKTVIELLVREEELKSALIGDEKNSAVMQSEIRAMWMREETRWGKAMEGRKRAMEQVERVKAQGVVGFDEE